MDLLFKSPDPIHIPLEPEVDSEVEVDTDMLQEVVPIVVLQEGDMVVMVHLEVVEVDMVDIVEIMAVVPAVDMADIVVIMAMVAAVVVDMVDIVVMVDTEVVVVEVMVVIGVNTVVAVVLLMTIEPIDIEMIVKEEREEVVNNVKVVIEEVEMVIMEEGNIPDRLLGLHQEEKDQDLQNVIKPLCARCDEKTNKYLFCIYTYLSLAVQQQDFINSI